MTADNNRNKPNSGIMVNADFKCSTPVQLRYNDIDTLGHVNNSIYFNLFDIAKADYFNRVTGKKQDYNNICVMIAHIECDYMTQTRLYEPVAVETQTTRIGEKSMVLVHQLVNTTTGEVKCRCSQVLVYFDRATGATSPVPQAWRKAIEKFEGHSL